MWRISRRGDLVRRRSGVQLCAQGVPAAGPEKGLPSTSILLSRPHLVQSTRLPAAQFWSLYILLETERSISQQIPRCHEKGLPHAGDRADISRCTSIMSTSTLNEAITLSTG